MTAREAYPRRIEKGNRRGSMSAALFFGRRAIGQGEVIAECGLRIAVNCSRQSAVRNQ
jgi:hypothetical protein